jgi:hypothetical protein
MPSIWRNNIIVVTKEELIPAFYPSYNALKLAIFRAEQRGYGVRRAQYGGYGHDFLVDFDSLPRKIQEELGDPRKCEHPVLRYYERSQEIVDLYTGFRYDDGDYIRKETLETYITNGCMWRAIEQLKAAREHEILSKNGKLREVNIMQSLCNDAISFNPILLKRWGVEHTLPAEVRRFKERFARYTEGGLIGLLNTNKGNKNPAKLNDKTLAVLNNMFGTQSFKPNYEDISNQYAAFLAGAVELINEKTGEIYNPSEFKALSRSTIYNYLKDWGNAIATEAKRSGNRQTLMAKYRPAHSLDQPQFAGSIISVDDRQPPFEYAKGSRIWFYNGVDLGSEALTTWVYGKSKDGIILDFYRQMVRNYAEWGLNLPAEIECESSLNSSFTDTFLKEGSMFQYVRVEANNARAKRCEAYWRQLRYGIEKKHEGWIARPFAMSESNQASSDKVPFVPYDLLVDMCLKDIETWNNMPHSVHKDKTRWEVFMERQNPNLRPTNYKAILPYLGYKTQTSVHAGILKLQNREWLLGDEGQIYTGEKLIGLMQKVEGQNVDVYWLDGNDGSIIKALVYINSQLVCEALPKPSYARARIEMTDEDTKARELMSKYVATIDGYASRQKKLIDNVIVIDNRKVTLNDNFKISRPNTASLTENRNFETGEELAEPDDDLIPIETSFKRDIKDRF